MKNQKLTELKRLMVRQIFWQLIFVSLVLTLVPVQGAVSSTEVSLTPSSPTPLTLGIFPRRNAGLTYSMFKPVAEYLSRQLGREVKIVTAKNFNEFWLGVEKNQYDIVHYNQLHYIDSHDKQGYNVILMNEEFGTDKIRGALAVRTDSGIQNVMDLKGKKILFGGGKKAMVAYVVNTYTLRQAGLGPNDYTELFAVNPPNATIATYFGRADAAGVGDVGLRIPILKNKGVDVRKMKLVGISQPLPHLAWAAKRNMSKEDREKIQTLLVNLKNTDEGKLILNSAKLTGLKIAEDKDYKIHREILEYYRQNYRIRE